MPGIEYETCPYCKGKGLIKESWEDYAKRACNRCNGTGKVIKTTHKA